MEYSSHRASARMGLFGFEPPATRRGAAWIDGMAALPQDVVADLNRRVAELEQRLESSFAAHDEAIAQQAATAQENARLRNELGIARDRQSASADILRTIASASGDAERSLYQIAETTMRLFGAQSVTIQIAEG